MRKGRVRCVSEGCMRRVDKGRLTDSMCAVSCQSLQSAPDEELSGEGHEWRTTKGELMYTHTPTHSHPFLTPHNPHAPVGVNEGVYEGFMRGARRVHEECASSRPVINGVE